MKIRLLQSWKNGEDEYPKDAKLGLEDEEAKGLIEQGIAVDIEVEKLENERQAKEDARVEKIVSSTVEGVMNKFAKNSEGKLVTVLEPMENKPLYDHVGEFLFDVIRAGIGKGHVPVVSPRLKKWHEKAPSHTMVESDDEQGGHLVPVEFLPELLEQGLERSVVYGNARKIIMARNRMDIPTCPDTDHSTSPPTFHGGAIIYWEDEAEQKTTSKPKFEKIQMHLHKLIGLVPVSDELLEDSAISIPSVVIPKFSDAIRWVADDSFINGNGVGTPLGILNCTSLVNVARAGAGTIVLADVAGMLAQFHPVNDNNCVWLANRRTLPHLITLAVGTTPVWVPSQGGIASVAPKPLGTLFGYPVMLTEKCSALGQPGDIILADLSQYLVGMKASGIQVAQSIHLWFDYDVTAFRFVLRVDGKCAWRLPLTTKDGTTESPFVVLTV